MTRWGKTNKVDIQMAFISGQAPRLSFWSAQRDRISFQILPHLFTLHAPFPTKTKKQAHVQRIPAPHFSNTTQKKTTRKRIVLPCGDKSIITERIYKRDLALLARREKMVTAQRRKLAYVRYVVIIFLAEFLRGKPVIYTTFSVRRRRRTDLPRFPKKKKPCYLLTRLYFGKRRLPILPAVNRKYFRRQKA